MRALTAYEDTNMYGGAHVTNVGVARRAAEQGRDLVVHHSHYDGQRYRSYKYRVTGLCIRGDDVIGYDEFGNEWVATCDVCDFCRTGEI